MWFDPSDDLCTHGRAVSLKVVLSVCELVWFGSNNIPGFICLFVNPPHLSGSRTNHVWALTWPCWYALHVKAAPEQVALPKWVSRSLITVQWFTLIMPTETAGSFRIIHLPTIRHHSECPFSSINPWQANIKGAPPPGIWQRVCCTTLHHSVSNVYVASLGHRLRFNCSHGHQAKQQ